MRILKTITALLLSLGILVSIAGCGKRGAPIRPSEVAPAGIVTDSAS